MTEQLHCSGPTGRISWIIKRSLAIGRSSLARDQQLATSDYFLVGVAGADCVGACSPDNTDLECPPPRAVRIDSAIEVTIKMMADQVVALVKTVAAPRGPKAVWLP